MRFLLALMIGVWSAGTSRAADVSWSVERLSRKGWEIAGFTGTSDIRGFLILFKHRDRVFLVQCSTFYDVTRSSYDVTRSSRVTLNCYELH